MHIIDPHLYLREHQRHVARVTEDGLRRLEAARAAQPRSGRSRLTDRIAWRVRAYRARPVTR